MGGDTKMELGFPATPLSAVPGICPERGVQPARRPSFAFGEGKFGTLKLPLLAVVVPLSASTEPQAAPTQKLHRWRTISGCWCRRRSSPDEVSARRGGKKGLPISSVELQGWAVFQNACAARKKLFRSYPMRFRPALPAPFQLFQR